MATASAVASLFVQSKSKVDGQYLWAHVFLDGRRMGTTALALRRVRRGHHVLRVERDGYRTATLKLDLRPGEHRTVLFELRPLR